MKTDSISLIGELEVITCQWERLKIITSASRLLSSSRTLSYTKSMTSMPTNYKHCTEFATLLMNVLTIKNLAIHNYEKFTIILIEKYKQDIETLQYHEDIPSDNISEQSNSTHGGPNDRTDNNEDNEDDTDSNKELLRLLKKLSFNDDIQSFAV